MTLFGGERRFESDNLGGHMITWWLLGGLVVMVAGVVLYREWKIRRHPMPGSVSVMTKTTDGQLLQFLVRPTRKIGRE